MQVNLLSDYILQKLNKDINESSKLERLKNNNNGKKRIFQKRDKAKHR